MTGGKGALGLSVLIVESDPRVRSALARIVRSEGMRVTTAQAPVGSGARSKIGEKALPDVALISLDHDLPSALLLIRELAPRDVRVVALGANDASHREALAAGASAFIEKDERAVTILSRLLASLRPEPRHSS